MTGTTNRVSHSSVQQDLSMLSSWTRDLVQLAPGWETFHLPNFSILRDDLLTLAMTNSVKGALVDLMNHERRNLDWLGYTFLHRTVFEFIEQRQGVLIEWMGSPPQMAVFRLNSHIQAVHSVHDLKHLPNALFEVAEMALARIFAKLDSFGTTLAHRSPNRHWTSHAFTGDCLKTDLLPATPVPGGNTEATSRHGISHKTVDEHGPRDVEGNELLAFLLNIGANTVFWEMLEYCGPAEVFASKQFWLECALVPVFGITRYGYHVFQPSEETVLRIIDELGADVNLPIPRNFGGSLSSWQLVVHDLLNGHERAWDKSDHVGDQVSSLRHDLSVAEALLDRGADPRVDLPEFLLRGQHVYRWVEGCTVDVSALVEARMAGEMYN
ncbi:hypothetical protein DOTSEDRAFT_22935 [Dothistroma septosporum NZE10]|uniref:Uncharacterized protein n=1 Tax=Dothistroma septosporum (strain NZE10 / CBS 128990) TaxID=675120 RepID=N1PVG4_DOTSN|nr:hypothetical protein DOTSEDRAFT_22935 [Dothistroma septosporum NZE10]